MNVKEELGRVVVIDHVGIGIEIVGMMELGPRGSFDDKTRFVESRGMKFVLIVGERSDRWRYRRDRRCGFGYKALGGRRLEYRGKLKIHSNSLLNRGQR